MRFELLKVGGVTGIARAALSVDTTKLAAARASELVSLAQRANLFDRPSALGRADAPDEVGYELTVTDGARQARVEFAYRDADEPLQALIRALRESGPT